MQDIGTMANHKIKLKQVFDIQSTKNVLQHQIGDIMTLHITGPLDASSTTSLPSAPFSCLGWNASGWAGTSLRVWLGWNEPTRLAYFRQNQLAGLLSQPTEQRQNCLCMCSYVDACLFLIFLFLVYFIVSSNLTDVV